MTGPLRWDIFCQVIDNHGDIGVCWRLAAELGARGHCVRLWVDDASALAWMAPQGAAGVQVLPWPSTAPPDGPGDVVVEAFGCEIAPQFIAAIAHHTCANGQKPLWINLEYLSAEGYVERCHRLPSPLMNGPGKGLTRWFLTPASRRKPAACCASATWRRARRPLTARPGARATALRRMSWPCHCFVTSRRPCPSCSRNCMHAATRGSWSRRAGPRLLFCIKLACNPHGTSANSYLFHILKPARNRPLTKCSGPRI